MHRFITLSFTLSLTALAGPAFPPTVVFDNRVTVNESTFSERTYDEAPFIEGAKTVKKRGHAWRAWLTFVPEGSNPSRADLWAVWQKNLTAQGWKVVGTQEQSHSLKRVDGKVETWLNVGLADFADTLVQVVRVEPAPTPFKLNPPAADERAVGENEDWPFVGHFPGAVISGTGQRDEPFMVPSKEGARVVADGSVVKTYTPPPSLSQLETILTYRAALTAAGWAVEPTEDDANSLLAHFSKNNRDVWLSIGRAADDSNTGLSYVVADVGAQAMAKALDATCQLTLRGVNFDFNKSTLQKNSESSLQLVATALKARPTLLLEVQGHTDNVGDEAYNDTLSQARAETVRTWLTSHGVPATQLTAKGYGKRQPVAENDTDLGRARNRRVALQCRK